jgi:hypothetical protein
LKSDSGSGWFYRSEPLVKATAAGNNSFNPISIGACTVTYAIEQESPSPAVAGLDAGKLEVTGSGGAREIEKQATGSYASSFGRQMEMTPPIPGFPGGELYLSAGEYTITGSGGADVGPFQTRIKVWADATWTNRGALDTVNRSTGLRIEWANATEEQLITVMGTSSARQKPSVSAVFICTERGDKGFLTVPAAILSALPATPAGDSETSLLTLGVSAAQPVEFSASGLDRGTAAYTQSMMRTTKYE